MNKYKSVLLLLAILLLFFKLGCDDSGFGPSNLPPGLITVRQNNLKQLESNIEGSYQMWLRLDTAGLITDYSLGKFNIGSSGEITNTSGGTMEFIYPGDTNQLYQATLAYVTVESPNDTNPGPSTAVLLSGQMSVAKDSIYGTLTIGGSLALGSAGQELQNGANAGFSIAAPTAGYSYCWEGVWFCDTSASNNSLFPANIQLTTSGWYYQGWVVDNTSPGNPVYYTTGRFSNPYGPDFDGAGTCAGTLPPYQRPGQDWIRGICPTGTPQMSEQTKTNYGVLVTLEPSYEQFGSQAFQKPFLKIYEITSIFGFVHCGTQAYMYSQRNTFPHCQIKITR